MIIFIKNIYFNLIRFSKFLNQVFRLGTFVTLFEFLKAEAFDGERQLFYQHLSFLSLQVRETESHSFLSAGLQVRAKYVRVCGKRRTQ